MIARELKPRAPAPRSRLLMAKAPARLLRQILIRQRQLMRMLRLLRLAGLISPLRAAGLLLLLSLQALAPAHAGRSCEDKRVDSANLIKAMTLAGQTRQALEQSGAQVALIARVGQDLSQYGLRYSHMAFVWRDHPDGRWLVVHELNTCGTGDSALYDEGLGNFFLDDLFAWESKIIIPGVETQTMLAAMLASKKPLQLHSAHYNMLAFPFATTYQNSNQWLLEVYAAAHSGALDRSAAQAWLRREGYQPVTIHISTVTRLGARMFRANVAFDDQPFGRRMAGEIDTVTVDSVINFVHRRDLQTTELVLSVP